MKSLLTLLLFALVTEVPSLRAGEEPPLSEHLRPLARLLGAWTARSTDVQGHVVKMREIFKPDAGATILRMEQERSVNGAVVYSAVYLFFWQPETKEVAALWFTSSGARGSGPLVEQSDQEQVFQGSGRNALGQFFTATARIKWLDSDTFTLQVEDRVDAGTRQPPFPVETWTRAKE